MLFFPIFLILLQLNSAKDYRKKLPTGLEKFFFTDNGSSAIEAAMKMSFQYHHQTGNPQKKRFMALTDAYHGETLGALSVSGWIYIPKFINQLC